MKPGPTPQSKSWLNTVTALFLLNGISIAQTFPPPPSGHLLDDANLFSLEQRSTLDATLDKFAEDSGSAVYVFATTLADNDNPARHAAELASAWLGDKPGLVIVFARNRKLQVIGTSPGFWRRYTAGDAAALVGALSRRINDGTQQADARVAAAANEALAVMSKWEKSRRNNARLVNRTDARLAGAFAVAAFSLGLLAWILVRWRTRERARNDVACSFPDVPVPARLGAQFGGGTMAEVRTK